MRVVIVFVVSAALLWTSVPTAWAQQGPAKCRLKADPLLPGAASFLIPGLGQFLNGEDGKGLTHLLIAIVLPSAVGLGAILLLPVSPMLSYILLVAAPVLYLGWAVASAMDAYQIADKYCRP